MTMMPFGGMQPPMPPMPTPEQIESAQLIVDACSWEEISGVLRSDDRRNLTIDVETDETSFDDAEAEKQQRTEFMTAMTQWMQFAIPAIQMNPTQAPLFKELTMFFIGAFKAGRTLEESFEDAFDQIKNAKPQPDPEAQKLQAEMDMAAKKFAMDMQLKQADLQDKQQTAAVQVQGKQADLQMKQQSAQMDMAAEQQRLQMELAKAQMDLQVEREKIAIEREKMQMEREKMGLELQAAQQKAQLDAHAQMQEHQLKREGMQMEGEAMREKASLDRQSMHDQHQMAQETSQLKRDDMKFNSEMKRKQAAQQAKSKGNTK